MVTAALPHLDVLEAESIHIMREVVAESSRPAMLYSVGKDSSVMLRLAQKAFYPGRIPFPLIHVDTGFKFREMIEFRDRTAKELGVQLIRPYQPGSQAGWRQSFPVGNQQVLRIAEDQGLAGCSGGAWHRRRHRRRAPR